MTTLALVIFLLACLLQNILAKESYRVQTLTGFKGNGQDFDRMFSAKHAFLKSPCGICFGLNDEIYVSDCERNYIFKIFPNESMIIYGGLGSAGFNGDGYDSKQTLFNSPSSLSVAPNGDLFIADSLNNLIRIVSAETRLVSSLPFKFNQPLGVHVSANNMLYIADSGNNVIKKYDINNQILTTIAGGSGFLDGNYDNVDANSIILQSPKNIHVISNGKDDTVYFTDNERVKSIDSNGKYRVLYISELKSDLNGIFVTPSRDIWTSSENQHFIQKSSLDTLQTLLTIGKKDSFGYAGDNSIDLFEQVRFYSPSSLIVKDSIILLADKSNNCVRKIDTVKKTISTFTGGLINHAYGENIPRFETSPFNILTRPFTYKNELYFVEGSNIIRKVSNEDNLIKTIFGSVHKLKIENSPTRLYRVINGVFCFPNGDLVIASTLPPASNDLHVMNLETMTIKKSFKIPNGATLSIVGFGDSFENGTLYCHSDYIILKFQNETVQESMKVSIALENLLILNNELHYRTVGELFKVNWNVSSTLITFPIYYTKISQDPTNGKIYIGDDFRMYEANFITNSFMKVAGVEKFEVSGYSIDFQGFGGENVNANQSISYVGLMHANNGKVYYASSSSYITELSNVQTLTSSNVNIFSDEFYSRTIVGTSPISTLTGRRLYCFCRDPIEEVIYMIDNNVLKKYEEKTGQITSLMPAAKMYQTTYLVYTDASPFFTLGDKTDMKMVFSTFDNMIYFSDYCRILQINPKTLKYRKIAGSRCGNNVVYNVPALETPLPSTIRGLSVNSKTGDLYFGFQDFFGKIEKSSGKIRLIFRNVFQNSEPKDGFVSNATYIGLPTSCKVISEETIYFSTSNQIKVLELAQNGSYYLRTIVGDGKNGYLGENVPALSSPLHDVRAFHVKSNGDIIIVEGISGNNIIRKYVKATGLLMTLSGKPGVQIGFYSGDLRGLDTIFIGLGFSLDFNEKTEETIFVEHSAVDTFLIRKLSPICEGGAIFNSFNNTCQCLPGYIGEMCQPISCNGTNYLDSKTCNGNGKCVEFNICECLNGFEGQFCEARKLEQDQSATILIVSIVIPIISVALIALIVILIIVVVLLMLKSNKKKKERNEIATITNVELSEFPTSSIIISSSFGSEMSEKEDLFSRYSNMVRIGAGSFGSVFKCTDTKSGNKVRAIKVVKFESFTDLNTIMKEASQLSNIKHPNIVKVNDYFITNDNLLCIDMDYYENGDLTRFTKKEACSEEIILKILKQMLSALNYVHSELSIIHRDIKPSNIFIQKFSGNDDIQVVLADFGLAKKYQEMKGQSYAGTPLFMSPEIALGSSYSFNTDIFSLGVSIYQIMTQDETFSISNLLMGNQSANAESILTQQMKHSGYSNELIQIVLQMLDKNQQTRPNADKLLQNSFFNK